MSITWKLLRKKKGMRTAAAMETITIITMGQQEMEIQMMRRSLLNKRREARKEARVEQQALLQEQLLAQLVDSKNASNNECV